MPDDTQTSYGTGLSYGSDVVANTPTYTEISKVQGVTPPSLAVGVTETKWLKKANRVVGKKPNWKTPGDLTATLFYDKDQMADLYALAGTLIAWKIDYPDTSTHILDGFISDYGQPELNGDDEMMIEITITVDGLAAFTAAT